MVQFQQAQQAVAHPRASDADTRAAALFRKAADAGNPLAAYNLGYCYEHGIGVSASIDQALTWYRRSASTASDPAVRAIAANSERSLAGGRGSRSALRRWPRSGAV